MDYTITMFMQNWAVFEHYGCNEGLALAPRSVGEIVPADHSFCAETPCKDIWVWLQCGPGHCPEPEYRTRRDKWL